MGISVKDKAYKLIEVTDTANKILDTMDRYIEKMKPLMKDQGLTDTEVARACQLFIETAKGDSLYLQDKLAEIYTTELTEENIDFLLELYSSSTGKKLLELHLKLAESSSKMGEVWGAEISEKIIPILTKEFNVH